MKEPKRTITGIEATIIYLIDNSKLKLMSDTHLFLCVYYLHLKTKKNEEVDCENIIWNNYYPRLESEQLSKILASSDIIGNELNKYKSLIYKINKYNFSIQIHKSQIKEIKLMQENSYLDNIDAVEKACIKLEEEIYENEEY